MEFLIFLGEIVKPKISIKNLMTENKNQNIYLDANNLYGYAMPKFPPTGEFK